VGDGLEVVYEPEQLAVGGAVLEALPEGPDHKALYTYDAVSFTRRRADLGICREGGGEAKKTHVLGVHDEVAPEVIKLLTSGPPHNAQAGQR
jgi:hypothetical protein